MRQLLLIADYLTRIGSGAMTGHWFIIHRPIRTAGCTVGDLAPYSICQRTKAVYDNDVGGEKRNYCASTPWLTVDAPKLVRLSNQHCDKCTLVWALTANGELLCRVGITPSAPGGDHWKQVGWLMSKF